MAHDHFERVSIGRVPRVAVACAAVLLLLASLPGCSVFMAAKQPDKKDLTVLQRGTPRDMVIGELGTPTYTQEKDGAKVDYFSFTQGYSKGNKTGRAVLHGTADVATLGLWEVIGTPTEAIFDGTDMKVKVFYDDHDRVASVENLTAE